LRIHPHHARQMMENLFLAGIRHKFGIGPELELNQAALSARILVPKSVGKGRKHSVLLRRVLALFLFLSTNLGGIGQHHLYAGILPSLLLRGQKMSIYGPEAVDGSSVRLAYLCRFKFSALSNDPAVRPISWFFFQASAVF